MTAPVNKAVFLDRDGVINSNKDHYYVYNKEDFKINEGVMDFIRKGNDKGFLFFVISNQSGIAKDLYTIEQVDLLHEWFNDTLRVKGLSISEFYYCTHHPDTGRCLCRKPGSLLIEKALARFDIDPGQSFLFGDQDRDVEAAQKAGVTGIKIQANANLMNYISVIEG